MIAILLFCILAGAVTGMRLTIFALVPVIVYFGLALTFVVAAVRGLPIGTTLLSCTALSIGLQVGYIAMLLLRCLLAGRRAPLFAPLTSEGSAASRPVAER